MNKICHLISVKGVCVAKPPTAYINTKSILHRVSYISAGQPDRGRESYDRLLAYRRKTPLLLFIRTRMKSIII